MMNHLSLQRTLKTNTQLNNSSSDLTQTVSRSSADNHGSSVTPSTITIEALQQDDFWSDLQLSLLGLVGAKSDEKNVSSDQPMVKVNAGTGLIIVRTYPQEMRLVEQYLAKTQHILGREVIIEAEILDVTLSSEYSSGIDWSVLTAGATTSGNAGLLNSGTVLSNVYTLSMSGDNNNFSYALNLLSTQGKVSVLSKPRISTMNNQSAIIKIGSDSYYVTSVESQLSSGGNNSSDTTTSTINLQAYFSGIALYVTPQITDEGEVNLHIHPSVSQVTEDTLNVTVDNQESVLPVARSQIRETDTMVRARDGQVVILGGLMQTGVSAASSGLPLKPSYSDVLGGAITSKEKTGVKSELVILLRPIIVQEGVWPSELGKIAKTAYNRQSETEVMDDASRS
ncbi:MAG: secretin N-terminal domain-containing protein [Gammaproteobacteria bacterium]|nr:secretin N-terminal domain-containing protein [Gammaproteobacteria bacterium]